MRFKLEHRSFGAPDSGELFIVLQFMLPTRKISFSWVNAYEHLSLKSSIKHVVGKSCGLYVAGEKIKSREIQRDVFYSLPLLTSRQDVDYAIILPNEDTFHKVIDDLSERSHDYFIPPKVYPKGGCETIVPSIGLVTTREKHLSVCFSYIQGKHAVFRCKLFTFFFF